MNRIFFFLVFCFFSFKILDAQVIINGSSNRPNVPVRLIIPKDLVSNAESVVAESSTDEKGNFQLSAQIQAIHFAQIAVGLDRTELVVKPNSSYKVEIQCLESKTDQSYFERDPPVLKVLQTSDDDLYRQISDVNLVYNTFVLQHFEKMMQRRQLNLLDTLRVTLESRLPARPDPFVSAYSYFKQASLKLALKGSRSSDLWLKDLLQQKPVLYDNPEYMQLLNVVFTSWFLNDNYFKINVLKTKIEEGFNFFLAYVSDCQGLAYDQQRIELISLINLRDLYFNSTFDQTSVIKLLQGFVAQSKFAEHRNIAKNLIEEFSYLSYATKAPDYHLVDESSVVYHPSDFESKNVLMIFVQGMTPAFHNDLEGLKSLYDTFSDKYTFVICSDETNVAALRHSITKMGIHWPVLSWKNDPLFPERYRVSTFPDYVVLLSGSRIGMAPAPRPDQYLKYHLDRLIKK